MWKTGYKTAVVLVVCGLLAAGPFGGPKVAAEPSSVSAQSAVLYEPFSGRILFQKDAHTPRPMASTLPSRMLMGINTFSPLWAAMAPLRRIISSVSM